jgi:hypothetical protein
MVYRIGDMHNDQAADRRSAAKRALKSQPEKQASIDSAISSVSEQCQSN